MVHLSLRLVGDIPVAPKRHQLKNLENFFLYTGDYHERIYYHQSRRRTDAFQVPLQTPAPGSGKLIPQKLPQEKYHMERIKNARGKRNSPGKRQYKNMVLR